MSIFTTLFGPSAVQGSNSPAPAPAPAPAADVKEADANKDGTKAPESPLDQFKGLFDTKDSDSNNDLSPDRPIFNLDTKQLSEAIGKMDFTGVLDVDLASKVAAGGEDAVKAMAGNMNKLAQAMLAQSLTTTAKMIDAANAKSLERMQNFIPDSVRKSTLHSEVLEENPNFKHPAIQPLIQTVTELFANKHPDASPREVKKMAMEYLNATSQLISGNKSDDEGSKAGPKSATKRMANKQPDDWISWLNN